MALGPDSSIQYVKGVGPRRAAAFASLGLRTVGDLLEYFPFRYEVEHGEMEIADLRPGIIATVRGEVLHVNRRWPNVTVEIDDGTQPCLLRWFNTQHVAADLRVGASVIASGKVEEYDGIINLIQPRLQVFEPDALLLQKSTDARRVGVYRGNNEIKSPSIRRAVEAVLEAGPVPTEDVLPKSLIERHDLPTRGDAVRMMHRPESDDALAKARRRLAYEEFVLMELAMALRRYRLLSLQKARKVRVTDEIDRRIRARFPFPLTASQNKVVREIARDLESGRPMTRLLQGDVGSGKTVVALYACLAAIAGGRQAAIMAPTEILAAQHFGNIEQYLAGSRVRHTLLRGKLNRKQRSEALAAIEEGDIDLVVGTQALLEKDVAFHDLALVVVDEQHKFGVVQRARIRTKGPTPHYLVMTATPIPRTLAMTVFGDLDVSIIDASPPGRGSIATRVVPAGKWDTVMRYVRTRLEAGEQAYVVCPLIGEQEDDEASGEGTKPNARLVSATRAFERLSSGPWSGLKLGLLHGSLPPAEKQATIDAFANGDLHAVIATTVVEVGVDVPNATAMIVENADRFGLSQLHQLRGRVGRGSKESLCVFISRGGGQKARERLAVLADTTDGFKIAEADLRLRGPGEMLGTQQHGLPELRVGDLLADFELLEQARRDAFDLVAEDPKLERREHAAMLPALRRLFGGRLSLIDVA